MGPVLELEMCPSPVTADPALGFCLLLVPGASSGQKCCKRDFLKVTAETSP